MFTSDEYISPPSLALKLKSCQVVHKWIPKAEQLKRIFTPKKCKCEEFWLQTRLGVICSTDVIMQLQISVTASVMKTLGSISSGYFCCVLALTLFSVPPAGSSFSPSGRWRRCSSTVVAHGIRYGLCRYSHDRKGSFLDFQKSPFSNLIWCGTKVELSPLRRTLGRLLRNSCCRLVASLVRSLNLVFCLPCFSLIKNSLSFWVASMYVGYAIRVLSYSTGPVVLCSVWSRVYFLLLTSICEVAILFFL